MTKRQLPPYGKSYVAENATPFIAYGDLAHEYANDLKFNNQPPPMIYAGTADPADTSWPVKGRIVNIIAAGNCEMQFSVMFLYELYHQGATAVMEHQGGGIKQLEKPDLEIINGLRDLNGFEPHHANEADTAIPTTPPIEFIKASTGYDEEFSYLIKHFMPTNSLGMLFGQSGSFKSFQAISLASHIALGKEWNGAKVNQSPVLYIAGEGGLGVRRRIRAWELTHNDGRVIDELYRIDFPITFNNASQLKQLTDSIRYYQKATNKQFGLVILDTMARCFGAADENKTQDMNEFISACDRLKATIGATVLLVHHTGHSNTDRGRGSSALFAALDFEFKVEKQEGPRRALIMEGTKSKDEQVPGRQLFPLDEVEIMRDSEGEPVMNLVAADIGQDAPDPVDELEEEAGENDNRKRRKLTNGQMIVLDAIHQIENEKGRPTYEAVRDLALANGLERSNYSRIVKTLKNQERIQELHGVLVSSFL